MYVSEFGTKVGDYGLVVEMNNQVGAVWVRIMDDYGHIDNETISIKGDE